MQTVSYDDWKAIIRLVTGCSDPTNNSEIDRCKVFDAVQALFRGAVNGQEFASDQNFRKLNKSTPEVANLVKEVPNVDKFLSGLRSKHLQSLGVHIVDPIAGRPSAIWRNLDEPSQILLTRTELYVCVWNQLYRRLFRPNASLINAIESGVLPWRWTDLFLPTVPRSSSDKDAWYSDPFFGDTRKIAREFHKTIEKFYPVDPVPGDTQQLTTMVQSVTNELIRSGFQTRLDRIALRFRDQIIDDARKKESLYQYLKGCFGKVRPDFLQTLSADNTEHWGLLSDIIQAIQSSILSQPAFCDESGLWLYRIKFVKSPSSSQTNIFFVFGLCSSAKQYHKNGFYNTVKKSFDNLQRVLEEIVADPSANDSDISDNELVTDLVKKIRVNRPDVKYHDKGLIRWLSTVAKIMAGAKHEGHAISYKIGYGSLAYAQTHLYLYEIAPADLSNANVGIAKIASYVKGFYSLFGNRPDRGLWFDELGQFCGVYESSDGLEFENHVVGRPIKSQHGETVLYSKIDGVGLVDILHHERNQIARIKNGKLVDMESGDQRRVKAVNTLVKSVAPQKLQVITEKLVHGLVEALQAGTHGTSFIVSFPNYAEGEIWKSTIEFQAKTLIRDFSRLEAPLATYDQLRNYAEKEPRNLDHIFKFLVELANLDGGLWLQLSEDNGLVVKAAQQFIPLLKLEDKNGVRPFDLQMKRILLGNDDAKEDALPHHPPDKFKDLIGIKTLFTALNGGLVIKEPEKDKYVKALSFLDHSGTKTHSLWGMSLTAAESCLCVVLSSDGNVYVFHDGREFTGIQKTMLY